MFALKDISLDVRRGEFIIIIGKIGSGKSSLLHALMNEMTFVPETVIDQYGGKNASITDDELKELRKNVYEMDYQGIAPIKIAGKVAYVEQ
jgi:cell division transport system ATP-binding protein